MVGGTAAGLEGEEEKGENGGKRILVAVQMDGNGRDLLDWTILKVAEAGDHLIAVHVYRKSDLRSQSLPCMTKALDDYLSEYDGLCKARKVILVARLAQGSSIRKTVVKEAEIHDADTLVVGVNKNASFRGPPSLSNYCARKLPPTISLFAVHNGRVTYERKAAVSPQGPSPRRHLSSILHPSLSIKSESAIPTRPSEENMVGRRLTGSSSFKECMYQDAERRENSSKNPRHRGGRMHSLSLIAEKLPEKPSGWPLLQRQGSNDLGNGRDGAARDMSVVQWVMNLPSRSQSPQAQEDPHVPAGPFEPEDLHAYADLCKKLEATIETSERGYRWFSRSELEESTRQFSSDNLIGNGGCSRVFRGCFSDGLEIAVKVTKMSLEALRNFILEAEIITTVQHSHIVDLIGVCIDGVEIIAVYNFFSKGSLEENLHGKKAKQLLSWSERYKVAMGIAEALSYLHNECPRNVIHRDVKSSNILLSDDLKPQLSDFGLAVWMPDASSGLIFSDVVGTFGYLAPEYFTFGKVSDKVDVYAFGVVLLELLTGRRPICPESSKGQESLIMWVTKKLDQCDLMELIDPSIELDCDKDKIQRMILAASISIRRVARLRPKMSQVVALLRGEEAIEGWVKSLSSTNTKDDAEEHDEEAYTPSSSVASHLGVALQDIDDTTSTSSIEHTYNNMEDYLRGRWSRSSSFN